MTLIIEVLTTIFGFIGFAVYLHFVAYAIAWGWQRGTAKVKKEIYNYHIKNE
jgi:hypothetical protein